MATVTLEDFEDIYTAVCEELKVQLTDGTTVARIKRDVNMIYLNHVIPFKPRAWWWLSTEEDTQTYEKITTGTISCTDDSTTVTFSSAPASSVAGYFLKVSGFEEVIEISAHTAASSTATLRSQWRRGTISGYTFTLWKDKVALSSGVKEVLQVTHDKMSEPLKMVNPTTFAELRQRQPDYSGYPRYCTVGDFDGSGNRTMRFFPAVDSTAHTLHVQGVAHATELSANADVPLLPLEDRIVLFYGACSRAWARDRNESESQRNWQLFQQKLAAMAAKSEDAPKSTEISVDSDWLVKRRYRRIMRGRRGSSWRSE